MWNLRGVALLVGAVLGLSTAAAGATRTLQAQQVRTIVNEEGVGRVLVDFGALSEVSGQFITSAYLEFDLPSHRRQSDLNIQVLTLQRAGETERLPGPSPGLDPAATSTTLIPSGSNSWPRTRSARSGST